jgi:hypothetical protein
MTPQEQGRTRTDELIKKYTREDPNPFHEMGRTAKDRVVDAACALIVLIALAAIGFLYLTGGITGIPATGGN